jgi:hypothetical protein
VSLNAFITHPPSVLRGCVERDSRISLRRHYPDQVQRVGAYT